MISETVDLYQRGVDALVSILGIVDTESFLALVKSDKFDYTEWQKKLFEGQSLNEINMDAVAHAKTHLFDGSATII